MDQEQPTEVELLKNIKKSVSFNEECNVIHLLDEEFENEEFKNYRKIYWELFAIDRCRFKRRINHTAKVIDPILNKEHRLRVFNKYFNL